MTGPEAGGSRGEVARGAAVLIVTGVLLGLGYNALGLAGNSTRGLPWIAVDKVASLPSLEEVSGQPPAPVPEPGPEPAPPLPEKPASAPEVLKPAGTVRAEEPESPPAAAPDVPVIPDLPTPIMIQLPAVKKLVDANAALVIDARTPEEYAEGHIAGAISLPYETAITDPAALEAVDSGGRPIVVYCGGGTCEVSIHLAEALMSQAGKKRVVVFMGGWPEWQAAGYPGGTGAGR